MGRSKYRGLSTALRFGRDDSVRGRLEAREEVQLRAAEEAQLHPAEQVVHDRLRVADLLVARPARGLEAGVRELLAEQLERHAVLQAHRDRRRERVHQARDRRAFLRHPDEDLTWDAV